jgi:diguanylate cyclase (GGDEF)-like protein
LAFLLLEAIVYFAAMSALFRMRERFGIGIFFCALGTMHFLETYLASVLYVTVPGGFVLSPGSIVLFSGKLVMLLLVYIREDAATVRQPIYGLLFGNFLMVALVGLIRFHVVSEVITNPAADFQFMHEMGGLMVWGTILLFIDSILIILLYERSAAWFGEWPTGRIIFSAAVVLTFDQIGFFSALWLFVGVPFKVLYGGWIAKMGAAAVYGVLAGLYLRWVETWKGRLPIKRSLLDVFDMLTYRQRYEALLQQSGRDALTGLPDRGSFDRDARRIIAEAWGRARPVSLIIIDIDHFKDINDQYGHAAGDEALRQIGRALSGAVRDSDHVYRVGGEEFIVVCDGLAHSAAILAGERLRLCVAGLQITGLGASVTGSVGIATAPDDGADLNTLFTSADARLYAAKSAGRNRVVGQRSFVPQAAVVPEGVIRRPTMERHFRA